METQLIPFNSDQILTIKDELTGEIYVSIKPICEFLGIDPSTQTNKLKNDSKKWGYRVIPVPSKGGHQHTGCIPINILTGWLFSISPKRIKSCNALKLEKYQKECFQALYDYWTKGIAVRSNVRQTYDDIMDTDLSNASLEVIDKLMVAFRKTKEALDEKKKTIDYLMGGKDKELVINILKKLNPTQEGKKFKEYYMYEYLRQAGEFLKNKNLPYAFNCGPDKPFDRIESTLANGQGAAIMVALLNRFGWQTENFRHEFEKRGFRIEDLGKLNNVPMLEPPFQTKQKLIPLHEDKQEDGDNNFLQQLTRAV